MKEIIKKLEAKWLPFEKDTFYLKQHDTSNGQQKSYLNILFNPVELKEFEFARTVLNCEFPSSLIKLYEQFNGIMLFSESLRIYGVGTENNALYDSYDIVAQNMNKNIKSYGDEFADFIVFGQYSSCLFCFVKTNVESIYVVDKKQAKIVYVFNTVRELLLYYLDHLIKEYDESGKKIHYDKRFEGMPIANTSLEFI